MSLRYNFFPPFLARKGVGRMVEGVFQHPASTRSLPGAVVTRRDAHKGGRQDQMSMICCMDAMAIDAGSTWGLS